ncbi:uncharacterized protein TNIN_397241 [Trichonephila inaurata madagascariensis]|uniref:Uncharacterized protein n=1 Tax=Trichonephila inaurata madagascariensis TaxID=2747483 RepID=A0A8X6YRK2_9ARAC|nr:uncharacterized protein TNIN_397241 [Trichonephila inaurata madagascariensis]
MECESDNVISSLHEECNEVSAFSVEKNVPEMNIVPKTMQNEQKKDSSMILSANVSLEPLVFNDYQKSNDTEFENVITKNSLCRNEMLFDSEKNSGKCIYQIKNENCISPQITCNITTSTLNENGSKVINIHHKPETEISNESENASSFQKEFCRTAEVENDNLKMEKDFQLKMDLDDDLNNGSNNSNSDCSSSGIENDFDENMINNSKIDSKIEESKSEEASFINLTKVENNESEENKEISFDSIKFPYRNSSNPFEVVVPLIGKNVIESGDIKPFSHRYDLARERNRLKGLQEASSVPKISYHDWRKQRDARPQEEKDKEEKLEKLVAIKTAAYIIKISINILQELQNADSDQDIIEKLFLRFLRVPVSTLSLLFVPQFIHIIMYIRSSSHFPLKLRQIANECYLKCHVMFPIPNGYNFETVYTSEVKKNLPEQFDTMHNIILDYGDFECSSSESGDSAFGDE